MYPALPGLTALNLGYAIDLKPLVRSPSNPSRSPVPATYISPA